MIEKEAIRKGKEIIPIDYLGKCKIILSIENIGNLPVENLMLMDKVPEKFEYGNYSIEPDEVLNEYGGKVLKWTINTLETAEYLEVSYMITGSGEYYPSHAQIAFF